MRLSACIITYNQEQYIAQCLESALAQVVSFDFEIVIGEDKSTDGTLEICRKYAMQYPDKIRLIERETNLGMFGNWTNTFESCTGKYIAICEGDDYWTDPLKLQKQVDFLEANSEFGLYHTNNSRYIQDTQKSIDDSTIQVSSTDVFYGLIKSQYPISTLTTVFHKKIWQQYIVDIIPTGRDWLMCDLPFWLYLSQKHKVHYQDDVTAVYRVIAESASNTQDLDKMIRFDASVKEVKLFFLEKYLKNHTNIIKIKKEVEGIYIYRKIIAFAKCKGKISIFFDLFIQFHKINREPRHFFGSFKQIFVRLF
jgi:glycosyltransferase involved in cell wall biosynthesis